MSTVISSQALANGLRNDFWDTYYAVKNRQGDGRFAQIADLSVPATNRQHEFAYFNAAPHMRLWRRGESIPVDAMDAVQYTVKVWEWGLRIPWSKWDREDEQTQSLYDVARAGGESAALTKERALMDCIRNTTTDLPFVPLAPDGAAMFATTAGGADRFGAPSGNLLTGNGIGNSTNILTDYYAGLEQYMLFLDGQGQPLLSPEAIQSGVLIMHPASATKEFEEAFLQLRQGVVYDSSSGAGPSTGGVAAAQVSNLVKDASRTVELMPSARLTDANDWYMFLKNPPIKPLFILERKALTEETALEGDNNSDHQRTVAEEYIQWHQRLGAGINLPFSCLKVSNS